MRNDIVATAVVPHQKLSDAHVDLATAHRNHLDLPDVRRVRVAVPSLHGAPEPARSRWPGRARAHRGLVLLLCLSLMPAVASAQADVAEVPENAHVKRYGVGWECDWGYRTAAQSCEAIAVPAHAHLDAFGGRWECDRGYRVVNKGCVPVEVPPHAFLNSSGHGWQCDRGYQRNRKSCVAVEVPANAYLRSSGDGWDCERGFRRSGTSCVVLVVPANARARSKRW